MTAQVVDALTAYSKTETEKAGGLNYRIMLGEEKITEGSFSASKVFEEINIPLENVGSQEKQLRVETSEQNVSLYSTLAIKKFRTAKNLESVNNEMTLTREYNNIKNPNHSSVIGDVVEVVLKLERLPKNSRYIVIEDQLPAGLVPINQNFNNERTNYQARPGNLGYNREYTKNGAIITDSGQKNSLAVYTYRARVAAAGKNIAPPAVASLMYSPEVYSRTTSHEFEVGFESKKIAGKDAGQSSAWKFGEELENQQEGKRSIFSVPNIPFVSTMIFAAIAMLVLLILRLKRKI